MSARKRSRPSPKQNTERSLLRFRSELMAVGAHNSAPLHRLSNPVYGTAVIHHVNLAGMILAERADVQGGLKQKGAFPASRRRFLETPDRAAAEIAEDVSSLQLRDLKPAVNVAACDRDSFGMGV